jgi:aconitate hydratase
VLARSFARIHEQNLIAFGVLPLRLNAGDDNPKAELHVGARLHIEGIHRALDEGDPLQVRVDDRPLEVSHRLTPRERAVIRAGGLIAWHRGRMA